MGDAEPTRTDDRVRTAAVREGSAEARAEAILEVSVRLFHRHGYHGVGMRTIADEVGIRTSSLYYHFTSKAAILEELARRATSGFIDEHLGILDGDGRPDRLLHELIRRHIIYFVDNRLVQSVARRELGELSPESQQWVREQLRRYQDRIRRFLADHSESGAFRSRDPFLTAMAVIDIANGANEWFRPNGALSLATFADRYATVVVHDFLNAELS